MPTERYFLDEDLIPHQTKSISGAEFHHLAHVMRSRKGDSVQLINGRGALAEASIQDLTKDKAKLLIEEVHQHPPSPPRLILAQAFAKQNRLDFILEKGTELGVDAFWLFPGHHSAKKECFPSQLERAQAVTVAALKQCGRLYLPSISLKPYIEEWDQLNHFSSFFGDLDPTAPLFEKKWKEGDFPSSPVVFITGPEGGFSLEEVESLKGQGATGVQLHENILRTETASLMALSLISHWLRVPSKL